MSEVNAESYTLRDKNGYWLGQVVLTSDGMFSAVTEFGNFSFAWRHCKGGFKEFLMQVNEEYFAGKMRLGLAYIITHKKIDQGCKRFAKIILPPLKEILKKEAEFDHKKMINEAVKRIKEKP